MLASIRPDNDVVSRNRNVRSWNDISASTSPQAKTNAYNNFLSLLSSKGKSSEDPTPSNTPARMTTTLTSGPTPALKKSIKRIFEEPSPFGFSPKRRALDTAVKPILRIETLSNGSSNPSLPANNFRSDPENLSPVDVEHESHPDVDMLTDDFESKVILRNQAVNQSKSIDVPKSFELEHPVTDSVVFEEKEKVRVYLKRKRDDGVHLTVREKGGYIPQELLSYGAVALPKCRASTLDNAIHPLLARSRFDDTPDAIYDQITPALRLASLWLSQPCCMQFWVTLALAPRVHDQTMSKKYGKSCQRIAKHVPLTTANTRKVIKHLHSLGSSDLVHFRFQSRLRSNNSRIYGVSLPICSRTSDHSSHHPSSIQKNKLTPSLIRLHSDTYISAHKLSRLHFPEPSQTLRFQFFLATLLLHELAHSIEGAYLRHRPDQHTQYIKDGSYMEPFWLDWTRVPEMGRAWEETTLGGEIQPINWRVDGGSGVGTSDWPPRGSDGDVERRVWWGVPMSYIELLFQKSTWTGRQTVATIKGQNGAFVKGAADWLKIPRNGACSLYINFFTTMTAAEARRIKEEEAREELEKAREMPPDKIRVKGDGGKEEMRKEAQEVVERVEKQVLETEFRVKQAEEAIEKGVVVQQNEAFSEEVGAGEKADEKQDSLGDVQKPKPPTMKPAFRTPSLSSVASLQEVEEISKQSGPTTQQLEPSQRSHGTITILDPDFIKHASDDDEDDSDYEPSMHDNDDEHDVHESPHTTQDDTHTLEEKEAPESTEAQRSSNDQSGKQIEAAAARPKKGTDVS